MSGFAQLGLLSHSPTLGSTIYVKFKARIVPITGMLIMRPVTIQIAKISNTILFSSVDFTLLIIPDRIGLTTVELEFQIKKTPLN